MDSGLKVFLSARRFVEFKHEADTERDAACWETGRDLPISSRVSLSVELAWLSFSDSLTIGCSWTWTG